MNRYTIYLILKCRKKIDVKKSYYTNKTLRQPNSQKALDIR